MSGFSFGNESLNFLAAHLDPRGSFSRAIEVDLLDQHPVQPDAGVGDLTIRLCLRLRRLPAWRPPVRRHLRTFGITTGLASTVNFADSGGFGGGLGAFLQLREKRLDI